MPFLSVIGYWTLILMVGSLSALADPLASETNVLDLQLDGLESRVLQRQGRPPRTRDLITDQDRRIAEQQIRALKTRSPRNARIPPFERQLDRIGRPTGRPRR